MKRLLLMRHGSSEWAESGQDDSDRALTRVGSTECVQVAQWLDAHDLAPDHALVSSALRTRRSWDVVSEKLRGAPSSETHDDLYLASPGTLLARIGELSDTVQAALVMAHNPGIEELARMLAGPSPDDAAIRDMMLGFPAAGLAVFTVVADAWDQVTVADTRLADFFRPGQTRD
ncbi:MAG: SixA phosphatase family protein [Alphaproteobacteria bacterium]